MDSLKIKRGLGRGLSSLIGDTKANSNIKRTNNDGRGFRGRK